MIARVADGDGDGGRDDGPTTVTAAIDAYEADVRTRGGDLGNVARLRFHLPLSLSEK